MTSASSGEVQYELYRVTRSTHDRFARVLNEVLTSTGTPVRR